MLPLPPICVYVYHIHHYEHTSIYTVYIEDIYMWRWDVWVEDRQVG